MNEKQVLETEGMEIDLIEIITVFLRKWWLILIAAILGVAVGIGYTKFLVTPVYQSQSMLYVLTNTTSVTSVADLQIGSVITDDFVVIATSKPVVDKAIDIIEKEENITFTRNEILGMISVTNMEDTRILVIEAVSENPKYACMVANAVSEATAERMEEITRKDPPTTVEMAEVSKNPINLNVSRNAMLGAIAGAVFVCAILLIQFLLNDNIKTEEDVEKYLGEVALVSIPYIKGKEGKGEELSKQKGDKREKKK